MASRCLPSWNNCRPLDDFAAKIFAEAGIQTLPQQGTVPLNDTWRVGDSPRASWGQSPSLGSSLPWVGDSPRVWVWVEFGLGTVPEFGLYRARNVPVWAMGLNLDSKTRGLTDADSERLA